MDILHTKEELIKIIANDTLSYQLVDLGKKYGNEEIMEIAQRLKEETKKELAKYNQYIGKQFLAPAGYYQPRDELRLGIVKRFDHFNLSGPICRFEYGLIGRDGYDNHRFCDLKEVEQQVNV